VMSESFAAGVSSHRRCQKVSQTAPAHPSVVAESFAAGADAPIYGVRKFRRRRQLTRQRCQKVSSTASAHPSAASDRPTDRPTDRLIERPTDRPTDRPTARNTRARVVTLLKFLVLLKFLKNWKTPLGSKQPTLRISPSAGCWGHHFGIVGLH
jgi:hypothetical protein